MRNHALGKLLLLAALLGLGVALILFVPIREYHERFLEEVRALGLWAPLALAFAFVPACLLGIPGSLLTIGSGMLFGVVLGTIVVWFGSTLGAAAAFLVGRHLGREWIEQRVAGFPKLWALHQAVAEQGFKIVFLSRLSPFFPFTVLNYAFSLSRVSFRDYILATWLGVLPGTILYCYLGSAAHSLAEILEGRAADSLERMLLLWVGLPVTLVASLLITWLARRALNKAIAEAERNGTPDQRSRT